jgi:hypothetical protein
MWCSAISHVLPHYSRGWKTNPIPREYSMLSFAERRQRKIGGEFPFFRRATKTTGSRVTALSRVNARLSQVSHLARAPVGIAKTSKDLGSIRSFTDDAGYKMGTMLQG